MRLKLSDIVPIGMGVETINEKNLKSEIETLPLLAFRYPPRGRSTKRISRVRLKLRPDVLSDSSRFADQRKESQE